MLPDIKKIKNLDIFTPTKWQTIILRNYGLVNIVKIAEILNTTRDIIFNEATRLGIEEIKYNKSWIKKGYITIIKNNWHILPYNQLMQLLDINEEKLSFILKEDDFLSVKLGNFKPYCEEIFYSPLTKQEIEKTDEIRKIIKNSFINNYAEPFLFYQNNKIVHPVIIKNKSFDQIVYNYSMIYGDALLSGEEIISDLELSNLAKVGINGIWFQGILSKLEYYPFYEKLSEGYKIRQKNLIKLIDKCKKYGINVFLYLNEPRALQTSYFNNETDKLKGQKKGNQYSLCLSNKEVREYLYNSIKSLVTAVPSLEGIITITMSENLTHCYSGKSCNCKICKDKDREELPVLVNNIIYKAIQDSGIKTRLIANLWGWAEYMGFTNKQTKKGIELLNKNIEILCVSEFSKNIIKAGIKSKVGEYSISNVGPCKFAKQMLEYAKYKGHKVLAKVQVNNSWEFAITPYIPVFNLVIKHMYNLKKLNISGLMLSWTLGGYPSVTIDLVNNIFNNDFDYDKWLVKKYGKNKDIIKKSVKIFSRAFTFFPYNVETLYCGVQQLGASNLLYKENTNLKATMVGYPYDDIISWRNIYSSEKFKKLLLKMNKEWFKGIQLLESVEKNSNFNELKRFAEVFYINMQSMYVQFSFNEIKEKGYNKVIKGLLIEEEKLTKYQMKLASEDSRIGYESSNHYYFTQNSFLEKLINLNYLKNIFN